MSRASVHVRPASPCDAQALVELAQSVDLYRGVFSGRPLTVESRQHFEERFAEIIAGGQRLIMVAEDDGEPVGFVVARPDDVGAIVPTPVMNVSHLIVKPAARKRGIGRALLASVVQIAEERGIDHLVATASSGSRDANRYLARLGFAPLVIKRIAPAAVLRRTLGMAETSDRLAMRRRMRAGRAPRPARAGVASRSSLGRGA